MKTTTYVCVELIWKLCDYAFVYVYIVYHFNNAWLALIYSLLKIIVWSFSCFLISTWQWVDHLPYLCGIPSATAETYAAKFTDNCLTNLDLPDLDKTIFNSLNITVPGDQLAILHLA